MKISKIVLLGLSVYSVLLLTACQNSAEEVQDNDSQTTITQEISKNTESTQDTTTSGSNAAADENTETTQADEAETENSVETSEQSENNEENTSDVITVSIKEDYLRELNITKKETAELRASPTDDTTYAMKAIEGKLFNIWDGLLNEVYGILEAQLSDKDMEALRIEERAWIKYRDNTAKEASLKYKGGSQEQLEYVTVLNNLTADRCFELVESYME